METNCPEEILEIIRRKVAEHPDDIDACVEEAWDEMDNLSNFEQYHDYFIRKAILELVHDTRHHNNRTIRSGGTLFVPRPNPKQRVKPWEDAEMMTRIYKGAYTYALNGMMLAVMTAVDLEKAKDREEELREGHDFNVSLCTELLKKVKGDKTVKDVYNQRQLEIVFQRLRRK